MKTYKVGLSDEAKKDLKDISSYLIYFEIDETARQVNVIAVIYGKRDQMSQLETMIEKC